MKTFFSLFKNILLTGFTFLILSQSAWASTQSHQFQLNGGLGVFVGTDGLGASFDFSLEPEYFITEHNSLALRIDFTAGDFDSFHIAGRWRYYFDLPWEKINIFAGLGMGGGINFNGNGFGDVAIPVFGWQYDLGQHFKIGSDLSFDIFFNNNNVAFATRLMPLVLKWAF